MISSCNTILMSLFLVLLGMMSVLQLTASSSPPAIAKPYCRDDCGNLKIPYPFGIGANCYHNKSYEITCDLSYNPPKTFLHEFNLEVMDISLPSMDPRLNFFNENKQALVVKTPLKNVCVSKDSINLSGSPFYFSSESNVLVMEGCGGRVSLRNKWGEFLTGCASICGTSRVGRGCFGVGCCQASFYGSEKYYRFEVDNDNDNDSDSSNCDRRVGLIDSRSLKGFNVNSSVPVQIVLGWDAPSPYVEDVIVSHANYTCYGSSCSCSNYHEGNPYLPQGCQVVRECRKCTHRCTDYHLYGGGPDGHFVRRFHCGKNPLLIGFSSGMGLMVLLLGCFWLYRFIKKKREVKRRLENFKRNGGLLLQQIGSSEGAAQKTKVFSVTVLEKATDNFNKNRILGQGGQGTVFKGMLKDGGIVAIKKSIKVDEGQLEQFVNEVVILSQINHRNVVKLLGCCLETEVPLLIYEFIQNGTLYQHIHDATEDFHITWKMRLQMAAESASAIAYLHSSSSTPIYHRDIKSANILLDAKFRAKVSDFGTSKSIEIEQTHVTTCVMGTYGYLDPEYFQSNQFTEKSDVYSFGVVLVELITGKKPIYPTKDGGWISLAVEFLLHVENARLYDILDARILEEGKEHEFVAVAKLATQCLNSNGKERPTMKQVAKVLEDIRSANVPTSSEPSFMEHKRVMSEKQNGSSITNTMFSDVGPSAIVSSSEIQQLKAHTL